MLKQVSYLFALILAMLVVFVAVERALSPFFQSCISENENPNKNTAAKEQPAGLGSIISTYVKCSERFIEGHGVGITALATIVIAAFTGTLWLATSQQARLTGETVRIAERALTELEAPFISIKMISPGLQWDSINSKATFGILSFTYVNYGRTPAMILEGFEDIRVVGIGVGLPAPINDERGPPLPWGVIAPQMEAMLVHSE
jgi:hypothetical protein